MQICHAVEDLQGIRERPSRRLAPIGDLAGRHLGGGLSAGLEALSALASAALTALGSAFPLDRFITCPTRKLELTRFRGHFTLWGEGVLDGTDTEAVPTGVS